MLISALMALAFISPALVEAHHTQEPVVECSSDTECMLKNPTIEFSLESGKPLPKSEESDE